MNNKEKYEKWTAADWYQHARECYLKAGTYREALRSKTEKEATPKPDRRILLVLG